MANGAWTGAAGGALSGAGAGAVFGPVGAGIGALIGLISGLGSGRENDRARKRADSAANIALEDPAQVAYLNRIRQLERQQRAAADPSSAFAATNARNTLGQTQANILRASGGNPAQGIQGLLSAQNATNNVLMGIGANAGQRADAMLQYQGGLIHDIAQRKLELQKDKRADLAMTADAGRQNLYNTLSTGLGLMPDIAANIKPRFKRSGIVDPNRGGLGAGAKWTENAAPYNGSMLPQGYQLGDLQPSVPPNYGFGYQ